MLTVARWVFLHAFGRLIMFFQIKFSTNLSWNLSRVLTSLDRFVRANLGPNCLQSLSADRIRIKTRDAGRSLLKRLSFGSKGCTEELKLECASFLGQTS